MIRARFGMEVPAEIWIADLSQMHPETTFRLLAGAPLEERTLELGEIIGPNPDAAMDDLEAHDSIVSFESLYIDGGRGLTKYETTEQGLFTFLGETSLPPEFPLTVQNGVMEFNITATRDQFDALGDRLEESPLKYDLLSVVHSDSSGDVLTPRQREFLETALHHGYYEVPRESTLADVAATLEVDKSTASVTLRRATNRIVDWFLLSTGDADVRS
ncbi:helix-turn-helix domain-containing protein [Haloarchaeobius amylolyticus]|uniref:helix-turn-helix domain-containing protein n=1 Tax=Haloarchaeobius amylolyticus TaxID=1198296 RepID=UPI00226F943B|nr:helix-turn-helix domain-containing protein [Haloarchaeobius amylolyticus]